MQENRRAVMYYFKTIVFCATIIFLLWKSYYGFGPRSIEQLIGEDLRSNEEIQLRMLHWDNFLEEGEEITINDHQKITVLMDYLGTLKFNSFLFDRDKRFENTEAFTMILSDNGKEKIKVFVHRELDTVDISCKDARSRLYKIKDGEIDIDFLRDYFDENKADE